MTFIFEQHEQRTNSASLISLWFQVSCCCHVEQKVKKCSWVERKNTEESKTPDSITKVSIKLKHQCFFSKLKRREAAS